MDSLNVKTFCNWLIDVARVGGPQDARIESRLEILAPDTLTNPHPQLMSSSMPQSVPRLMPRSAPQAVPRAVQSWPIVQLPGLNPQDQALLLQHGIQTTHQLLVQTKTSAQRQALATQLQMHIQHLNKWIALADLAQIPAVGCDYCGLLLHAGVCSVAQLTEASPPRIHRQILKLQVALMQRPDLCPSVDQVAQWIEQAKRIRQP
jgi:hypothetical protein